MNNKKPAPKNEFKSDILINDYTIAAIGKVSCDKNMGFPAVGSGKRVGGMDLDRSRCKPVTDWQGDTLTLAISDCDLQFEEVIHSGSPHERNSDMGIIRLGDRHSGCGLGGRGLLLGTPAGYNRQYKHSTEAERTHIVRYSGWYIFHRIKCSVPDCINIPLS